VLKTLPSFMSADLLWVLAAMGHGDRLTIVDRNFPAIATAKTTTSGRCVQLNGTDVIGALAGVLKLFPVDNFIETPLICMDPVASPGSLLPVQKEVHALVESEEKRAINMAAIDRFAFYEEAKNSFAVLHTTEDRPYGCFILTKGVVFND
jgi:L-fucose mutarotase